MKIETRLQRLEKKHGLYLGLSMLLVLLGCLVLLLACAPAQLTPEQTREFDQAIQAEPNNPDSYFNRGHAYYRIGQHQLAIEDFSRAIELDPNNARVYNSRGSSYQHLGQLELAVDDYSQAIKLDPNYGSAYYNRGNLWGRKGDRALACTDMRKACELFTEQGKRERAREACSSFEANCR